MVLAAILTDNTNSSNKTVFKNGFEIKEFNSPDPQPNQSVIKIQAAAFNHR